MARIFDTAYLTENSMRTLDSSIVSNIYNGLDCCVTLEVFNHLEAELESSEACYKETYQTSLLKIGPVMEMCLRGIQIDIEERSRSAKEIEEKIAKLVADFDFLCQEVFGITINPKSPKQVGELFYDIIGAKEIRKRNTKKVMARTTDETALNRLTEHVYAGIFARYLLALRELNKKHGFLTTELDPDNRIRTSINIAGTDTGRLSSSGSDFGTGTNLQNVEAILRRPFIADSQHIFFNVDLEQGDARNLGAILWTKFLATYGPEVAGKYLDFCESGDLHTNVCKMVFRNLPWTDDPKKDRAIADEIFYRHFSYRDANKKLGHGSNYIGRPPQMAKQTHIPQGMVEHFQLSYFREFPLIPEWHKETRRSLLETRSITTIFNRRRTFWDRPGDDDTLRKAVAYEPQSMTGHEIDMGLCNVWRHYPDYRLHIQVHDSFLMSIPFHNRQTHFERVMEAIKYPVELVGGRRFMVPLDAAAGFNWAYNEPANPQKNKLEVNPNGLKKWRGSDDRELPIYERSTELGRLFSRRN